MHSQGIELLLVVVGAIAVTALAERVGRQPALLVVVIAAAVSFVPGLPRFELAPQLILAAVVPPLLYSAALDFSFASFRRGLWPILSLGVGLVVVSALATGVVAAATLPGLTLAGGLLLGAVVAPPDAVAALAIGRELGLPRALMTVLTGESLVNDAAALTIYGLVLATLTGRHTVLSEPVLLFGYAALVGVVVGLAIGAAAHWIRMRLEHSELEVALTVLIPFLAYLAADGLAASGVLAVVAAGFFLGHHDADAGYATRLQGRQTWSTVGVLLESFLFAYMGLQTRFVFDDLGRSGVPARTFLLAAAAVLGSVLLVRPVWVFLVFGNRVWWTRRRRHRDPRPRARVELSWRHNLVLSWTGMRGVITLAAAAGVPLTIAAGRPFPDRATIQALAFVVTVGTVLLYGLTLPPLIRRLGVGVTERELRHRAASVRRARDISRDAARATLLRARAEPPAGADPDLVGTVVDRAESLQAVRRRLDEQEVADDPGARPSASHRLEATARALRRQMQAAQRAALVRARNAGELDDDVMRRELEHLDYEEAASAYDRTAGLNITGGGPVSGGDGPPDGRIGRAGPSR